MPATCMLRRKNGTLHGNDLQWGHPLLRGRTRSPPINPRFTSCFRVVPCCCCCWSGTLTKVPFRRCTFCTRRLHRGSTQTVPLRHIAVSRSLFHFASSRQMARKFKAVSRCLFLFRFLTPDGTKAQCSQYKVLSPARVHILHVQVALGPLYAVGATNLQLLLLLFAFATTTSTAQVVVPRACYALHSAFRANRQSPAPQFICAAAARAAGSKK